MRGIYGIATMINSSSEYEEKEARLQEIRDILERMSRDDKADKADKKVDLSKVISLRKEARALAQELKNYLKSTFEMKN